MAMSRFAEFDSYPLTVWESEKTLAPLVCNLGLPKKAKVPREPLAGCPSLLEEFFVELAFNAHSAGQPVEVSSFAWRDRKWESRSIGLCWASSAD